MNTGSCNKLKYKINPVKATCAKVATEPGSGIQTMNDTCFGICAAFSGTNDIYNMDPECTKSCVDLIEQKRIEKYGVGWCDHHAPYRPVVWDSPPHFIPGLLRSGLNPKQALQKCRQMCVERVPMLTSECQERCEVDFMAIEQELPKETRVQVSKPREHSKKKKDRTLYWVVLSITLLLLIIGVALLIKSRKGI